MKTVTLYVIATILFAIGLVEAIVGLNVGSNIGLMLVVAANLTNIVGWIIYTVATIRLVIARIR